MDHFTTISSMKSWIQEQKKLGKTIGFVPTMGFLHEGHLSLMKRAKEENDVLVASIFVNPLQFGEGEDFDSYPKDIVKDKEVAENIGVDALFTPTSKEMYPQEMSATMTVHDGVDVLCGASRPGHFNGMATVVMKLFGIVTPNRVYFGLKDAQQLAVIENFVRDYHLDLEIVRAPIVREEDGLAKSSRNVNLTKEERAEAKNIYASLKEIKTVIENGQETSVEKLESHLEELLEKNLSARLDYAEIRAFPSLEKLEELTVASGDILVALAVKYSKVRLIDNVIVTL